MLDQVNYDNSFLQLLVLSIIGATGILMLHQWIRRTKKRQYIPRCILMIGPPGAGKGTQCSKIVAKYQNIRHYSVGDLLRNTPLTHKDSDVIRKHIGEDSVVPVEISLKIMQEAMERDQQKGIDCFLIDGFPRNEDNLDGWNKYMSNVDLKGVIMLNVDDKVSIQRVVKRMRDENDKKEKVAKRLSLRRKRAIPVNRYYESLNMLYRIDANQEVESVFRHVDATVQKLLL